MAQDDAADFDLRDGAMPRRHETLVMIALDPDAVDRRQKVGQQRLVGIRHARPCPAVMKHITKEQQPRCSGFRKHSGEPRQRLAGVIGRQELARGMVAGGLFKMQVADDQQRLRRPEQRAGGVKLKAVAGEFSGFPRHGRRG